MDAHPPEPPLLIHQAARRPFLVCGLLSGALLLGAAQAQTAPNPAVSSTNLTLSDALAQLANSPQVKQANLALTRAQSQLDAAKAGLSLNVTVGGTANYNGAAITSAATSTDTTNTTAKSPLSGNLNLQATAGVLPWASNQTALASAQRSLNYAKALRLENIEATRLNAVQQYQNAYLAQLNVTASTQNLQSAQQILAAVQLQRSQQNATEESLLQAQAGVQNAQASLAQAQTALDTARRSLGAALGSDLGGVMFVDPPSLPDSLDQAGLSSLGLGDINTLVIQAGVMSSAVLKAQNTLADDRDTLATQQRNLRLPSLTLSANYGSGSSGLTAGLNLQNGTVNAGYAVPLSASSAANSLGVTLSGSYTIYGPAANAQVTTTQAQISQDELSLTIARQTTELTLRQNYGSALTALGAVAAKLTLEQSARVALQTAQARLAAGTATPNDVAAAQAAYAQSQSSTQTARAAAALSILTLQTAAGQTAAGGTP